MWNTKSVEVKFWYNLCGIIIKYEEQKETMLRTSWNSEITFIFLYISAIKFSTIKSIFYRSLHIFLFSIFFCFFFFISFILSFYDILLTAGVFFIHFLSFCLFISPFLIVSSIFFFFFFIDSFLSFVFLFDLLRFSFFCPFFFYFLF